MFYCFGCLLSCLKEELHNFPLVVSICSHVGTVHVMGRGDLSHTSDAILGVQNE